MLKLAIPEPFSIPVPRIAEPSSNVTVPVGTPAPGASAVIVAVNVTDWPKTDGLADEVTDELVASGFTTWLNEDEVLAVKLPSAPYTAVIEWLPTASAEVVNVAIPEPFKVPVPRVVEPSRNVTVPVGTPDPGASEVIVAVKVTDWPKIDGLAEEAMIDVVAS